MDRLQNGTQSGAPPALVSSGVPGFPILDSVWDPYTAHELIEEIRNVIVAAGIGPDPSILNQLTLAIEALIAAGANAALLGLVRHEVVITAPGAFNVAIPANALPWGEAIATGGGGGAGGTGASLSGGSGGSAGTAWGPMRFIPGGVATGVVGSAGVGGAPGADGTSGGVTTITSGAVSFNGGGGGFGQGGTPFNGGGANGNAAGASNNIPGANGFNGNDTSNVAQWANGAASFWGGGGRAGNGGGFAGSAYGSGGGARYGSAGAGSNGAPGVAVIRYWTLN